MKRKWLLLVLSIILLGAVAASWLYKKEEESPKVVVVLKSLDSEYWKVVQAGAEKAFHDFHVDGEVIAPQSLYSISDQNHLLRSVLKQNPDALLFAPTHPSESIPVLEEYKKRNIPVLFVDTAADWGGETTFIGTENTVLGYKAGALLGTMLHPGEKAALLHGDLSDPVSRDRISGAERALKNVGIEITVNQRAYDVFWRRLPVMESILEWHPDVKGVFATDDSLALDALKAIEKKGLNIPVIGTDGMKEIVHYVKDETLGAALAQNPYDMGYIGVQQALKAINGEVVSKRIDSGVDIITKDNAEDKLEFLKKVLHLK
ncbi:sugar ABC transporter substrate-binding protein [Bacillus taeanensis]|uniref:Sugar ABC transporter substrate-binding protein n=1 Tax=Bacillus taeanensis TaxID=273032 RepID=A0A366XNK1_9BACI|nr:sugar ABC transporter substrate-binding protein [Bacillus taeanensis]RBW67930.1 sugar ABC transporter substrate-binding protein [Bacillus taeanensis]